MTVAFTVPADRSRNTELIRRWRETGQPALLQRVLDANDGLVWSVARAAHRGVSGVELEDLVQEGRLGLLAAVRRFDPERGVQLVTLAHDCIYQKIRRALENQSNVIRIPSDRFYEEERVRVEYTRFCAERPALDPVAEFAQASGRKADAVRQALESPRADLSFDHVCEDGEGLAICPDTWLVDDGRETRHAELSLLLPALFAALDPFERAVIYLYFWEGKTLDEIGRIAGPRYSRKRAPVCRERIRHIHRAALAKLRATCLRDQTCHAAGVRAEHLCATLLT